MARANLEKASEALQSLISNPAALKRFDLSLTEMKHDLGMELDDETFRYVVNALITQKIFGDVDPVRSDIEKTRLTGGFQILAAIKM